MKIIFATHNRNKSNELKLEFKKIRLDIADLNDINYNKKIVENGETFFENAKIKAETIFKKTKIPTLADDSGLCINALNGFPGVYTEMFCRDIEQKQKNNFILDMLRNVPKDRRKASYVCSLYFIKNEEEFFFINEKCEGEISLTQKGKNGFGFDSIFYIKAYGKTIGEISMYQKNKISHRGKAIKIFKKKIKQIINISLNKEE